MATPFHRVNILTGRISARMLDSPSECVELIQRAERPLLVLGPRLLEWSLNGKLAMEYALELAKSANIPICATAHVKGKVIELGVTPDSVYDAVEIVNHLKDPDWKGVKKEGNHDLVIFLGVRTDLAEQMLSTLKHFAPHLKTMTLCKFYYPNANYSLPNFREVEQWKAFLESLIASLKKGG